MLGLSSVTSVSGRVKPPNPIACVTESDLVTRNVVNHNSKYLLT